MNVSIFGLGYVGCVSLGCLAQNGHSIIGVDVNQTKVDQINAGKATIIERDIAEIIAEQRKAGRVRATTDFQDAVIGSDVSILCVGTPSTQTGHLNLEYVFKVAEQIAKALTEKDSFHVIAIRSTVLPGTSEKVSDTIARISGRKRGEDFAVVSNPEFLREGTAVHDYYNPPFTLIGSTSERAAGKLSELYQDIPAEIIMTDLRTAEIMKYVNNSFHALKVGFANEIGNICQKLGIDSQRVMDIFVKDTRLNISSYYLKPGFAYGGSCLPKDLKAIKALAHDLYLESPIINAVDTTNQNQITKAVDVIRGFGKNKIAFLGLAFKSGTDDLRNSPTVAVIETLLGKGFEIKVFDKNVHLSKLTGTNKEFIETHVPHISRLINPSLDDVMKWAEVLVIATKEDSFSEKLSGIEDKMILDLVNVGNGLATKENYVGICW